MGKGDGEGGDGEFDEMLSQSVGLYTMLAAPCGVANGDEGTIELQGRETAQMVRY